MEKITLKLGEILQLENEINGFMNPENGETIFEGFLNQKLDIVLKYELSDLGDFLSKERKKIESLRDELIKKHGDELPQGGIMVKRFIEVKDDEGNVSNIINNPKFLEFDIEYSTLLDTEKEVEYPEISKQDLKDAGKTKDKYKILFKLIKK
jgi:hypothetical protein